MIDLPKMIVEEMRSKTEPEDYRHVAKKTALKKMMFALKHDKVELLEEAMDELETIKGEVADTDIRYQAKEHGNNPMMHGKKDKY